MKTLDEIINNADYKKLNGELFDRSFELAEKIRKAMLTAELRSIDNYFIRTVSAGSGFSDTALYIAVRDDDGELEFRSLEHRYSHFYLQDFNCWIEAADDKDRLRFLNDAKTLLIDIDEIKQKRIDDIKSALDATTAL